MPQWLEKQFLNIYEFNEKEIVHRRKVTMKTETVQSKEVGHMHALGREAQ
jgi:hypothetical protein